MPAKVKRVRTNSPAHRAGVRPGDELLSINGVAPRDLIDVLVESSAETVTLRLKTGSGYEKTVTVEKETDENLGIEFESDVFDRVKVCNNRCIFCFVDQLPPGLRPSLYLKDDDYRLSVLHGTYITLTNLTEDDWKRILSLRLSPLYVSVHTTNPRLRAEIMGNPRAGEILRDLKRLAGAGIPFCAQIVVVPGINDGPELEKTLSDLVSKFADSLMGISVVPVGVTRYNRNPKVKPLSSEDARRTFDTVLRWQKLCLERFGRRIVFAADEFLVMLGEKIPPASYYEGFHMLEDGVGLLSKFWHELVSIRWFPKLEGLKALIVTGEMAKPFMEKVARYISERTGAEIKVVAVKNRLFGGNVGVAGLLAGRDIGKALGGEKNGWRVVVPGVALRHEGRFIDDTTPEGIGATPGGESPKELLRALTGQ